MEINRIFKAVDRNGTIREFELVPPGISAENEGERQYRIAFSKSLAEGIFPREKLREVMRDHGMWTEEDDDQLKEAVANIAILQIDLEGAKVKGDSKKCMSCAKKIAEVRRRMWELFLVQQSVYMNSAEGVSELLKSETIMAACTTIKATGERYWKDYSEYVMERDHNDQSSVYVNVVEVQTKILDSVRVGLMEEYPEQEYLSDVQEKMLDRDIEQKVIETLKERSEAAIEKEKPKPRRKVSKKKAVRKKTSGKRVAAKTNKTS